MAVCEQAGDQQAVLAVYGSSTSLCGPCLLN